MLRLEIDGQEEIHKHKRADPNRRTPTEILHCKCSMSMDIFDFSLLFLHSYIWAVIES